MKKNVLKKTILMMCFASLLNLSLFGQCGINFSTQSYGSGSTTAVQIDLTGTSAAYTYSVNVDWGDGQLTNVGFTDQYIHTYSTSGTYNICVDYITVANSGCHEQVCKSYTVQPIPNVSSICPMNVTPSINNYTLSVNVSGSGASSPIVTFVHDVWEYIANPMDFSLIQYDMSHNHTFSHTYPSQEKKTYTYCVSYGDDNEPEACESNEYCSNVSFGSAFLGVENEEISYLQVFPVPADEFINIIWEESIIGNVIEFEIMDLTGKIVENGVLSNQHSTLLFPQTIGTGTYFLTVKDQSGKTNTVKFLKK